MPSLEQLFTCWESELEHFGGSDGYRRAMMGVPLPVPPPSFIRLAPTAATRLRKPYNKHYHRKVKPKK